MPRDQKYPGTTEGEVLSNEAVNGSTAEIPSGRDPEVTTAPPMRLRRGQVESDLAISYIAGSVDIPFIAADRALPQTIDDAERLYGIDIYERMKREPVLAGVLKVLKIVTLADGLTISPSHGRPTVSESVDLGAGADPDAAIKKAQDEYQIAEKMARYVREVIARLGDIDRPIGRTLWNLLDATYLGHKVAEVTYDHLPDGEFAGKLGLSEMRPKPRVNYAFVVDEVNRFRGIIAKIPGGSIALRQGLVYDTSQISNTVAPAKLLVLTVDDQDADPRGLSWFREIYDPWYRKQLFKPEHLKTGVQFGGGMISVTMPKDKRSELVDDPSGGQIVGGKAGKVTLLMATLWAAQQLRNGGVGVFENETIVNVHKPDANSSFFDSAFSMFDREMVTSFLLTARSILEARHGSKADSESAQDLLDELKMYLRSCLCELLTSKLFRTLVIGSFGPEFAQYTPRATMQRASRPDFAGNATAVAQLAGAIDALEITANQKEYLKTEVLGLPPTEGNEEDQTTGDDNEDGSAAMSAGGTATPVATFRRTDGRGISVGDEGRIAEAHRRKQRINERLDRAGSMGGSIPRSAL